MSAGISPSPKGGRERAGSPFPSKSFLSLYTFTSYAAVMHNHKASCVSRTRLWICCGIFLCRLEGVVCRFPSREKNKNAKKYQKLIGGEVQLHVYPEMSFGRQTDCRSYTVVDCWQPSFYSCSRLERTTSPRRVCIRGRPSPYSYSVTSPSRPPLSVLPLPLF